MYWRWWITPEGLVNKTDKKHDHDNANKKYKEEDKEKECFQTGRSKDEVYKLLSTIGIKLRKNENM